MTDTLNFEKMKSKSGTPFVIVFQGRCGSTYLVEALGSHPDITCWFEYFATMKKRKKTAKEQLIWVRKFLLEGDGSGVPIRGFKTKLRDVLDPDGFSRILKEVGVRIIHLKRRNTVKATVSFFNSVRLRDMTGAFNLYDKSKDLPPIVIDPDKFDEWLRAVEQTAARESDFVRALRLPTLELFYEDLLLDEHDVFGRMFSFLAVKPHAIKGHAIKVTSDRLQDSVGNLGELRRRYLGTPHEKMFDEILVDTSLTVPAPNKRI